MAKSFLTIAKISLVLVYLVIIAGAVVRMTGSGMGCPDWPKCFGYYIPPTSEQQLQWQEHQTYEKGQIIIVNESLKIARKDFSTTSNFDTTNWDDYTKHDYAVFNVWHTWIEYINRLVTVILGIPIALLLVLSFWLYKKDKRITITTILITVALGFQAWLGKTVVDSNLLPIKITVHMVMALVFVALLLYLIFIMSPKNSSHAPDKRVNSVFILSLGITLIQVIMGAQVRQFVDLRANILGEFSKNLWLQDPDMLFYIHRSFSILVIVVNIYLALRIFKLRLGYAKIKWVLLLILAEIVTGMVMYYVHFPFGSQPIHLLIASLLFGIQFYLILECNRSNKTNATTIATDH